MKLKTKLVLTVLMILMLALGVCGIFSVERMKEYNLAVLVESEQEKLRIAGRALQQVGTREDFQQMGETARDAYLKYQFERCYQKGYGLIKDGVCLKNLTDYEIVNLEGMKGEYMVQQLSGKQILLLRQPLEYPEGFEVLAVKDISSAWNMVEQQIYLYLAVYLGVSLAAAGALALCISHALRSLEELRLAAAAISRGELGSKVKVAGRDEIAQVGTAFNRMSEQVERQVEDLELLLGALAHEMKTPVTSVMGYADSLLHVRLSEKQQRRAVENIYDAGARMEQMSAKLLGLIGSYDNESLEQRQIPVSRLFKRVRQESLEIVQRKKLRLVSQCDPSMEVTGDETLLSSLVVNLIHNGCKASEPGGRIVLEGSGRTISVTDYGCGIPAKDLPYVTKAFYMADKSRSRSEGGSGLGLALGERIAALHGAELVITSQVGKGTRVEIVFPGHADRREKFTN